MNLTLSQITVLSLFWIVYFIFHSALASLKLKTAIQNRWPKIAQYYRAYFNLLAIFLLIPPLWAMHSYGGTTLWVWQGTGKWLSIGILALATICFIWTSRYYNMQSFLGFNKSKLANDAFTLSPMHRFTRHPWYFLALVIIWTRDMNSSFLVTAILMTTYFIIGAKLEERKLCIEHPDRYPKYQSLVPMLLPNPWHYLSTEAKIELMKPLPKK